MIRGWYTGASGMNAQQNRLDAISNNLANVDTAGYKKDITVSKSSHRSFGRFCPGSCQPHTGRIHRYTFPV